MINASSRLNIKPPQDNAQKRGESPRAP